MTKPIPLITDDKAARKARAIARGEQQATATLEVLRQEDAQRKAMGRPTKLNETVVEKVLTRLARGDSLAAICKDDDMPERQTINLWQRENADFCSAVTRARREGAPFLADSALEIADTVNAVETGPAVARDRLRVDTRLKLAGFYAPDVYGTRPVFAGLPGAGQATLTVSLSAEQLARLAGQVGPMVESTAVDVTPR